MKETVLFGGQLMLQALNILSLIEDENPAEQITIVHALMALVISNQIDSKDAKETINRIPERVQRIFDTLETLK